MTRILILILSLSFMGCGSGLAAPPVIPPVGSLKPTEIVEKVYHDFWIPIPSDPSNWKCPRSTSAIDCESCHYPVTSGN